MLSKRPSAFVLELEVSDSTRCSMRRSADWIEAPKP